MSARIRRWQPGSRSNCFQNLHLLFFAVLQLPKQCPNILEQTTNAARTPPKHPRTPVTTREQARTFKALINNKLTFLQCSHVRTKWYWLSIAWNMGRNNCKRACCTKNHEYGYLYCYLFCRCGGVYGLPGLFGVKAKNSPDINFRSFRNFGSLFFIASNYQLKVRWTFNTPLTPAKN